MKTTGGDSNWALLWKLYCGDLERPSQSVALSSAESESSIAKSSSLKVLMMSYFPRSGSGASNFNEAALRHKEKVQYNDFILARQRQQSRWLPTAGKNNLLNPLRNFAHSSWITLCNSLCSSAGGQEQLVVTMYLLQKRMCDNCSWETYKTHSTVTVSSWPGFFSKLMTSNLKSTAATVTWIIGSKKVFWVLSWFS